MLPKILIACALLVAVQAGYSSSSYGGYKAASKPSAAGIAAQIQPVATLTILPSYGNGYNAALLLLLLTVLLRLIVLHAAAVTAMANSYSAASTDLDPELLHLINLIWALPSAGAPNAALINVPQYSTTVYTAPAVAIGSDSYGNAASSSSAAAAAANVKSVSSGYGPAPAPAQYGGSGYGSAPAPVQYAASGYGSAPVPAQYAGSGYGPVPAASYSSY
ncbi:hypothetical protein DOY81_012673 [Sarcophaga bullata]|nr:hypothetical protein DOY81_012673 [Sarcophaga bullata]